MTLHISKIISKVISSNGIGFVSNHKQGELIDLINGVDVFTITGQSKLSKLNRIKQIIESNGFTCSSVNWEENAGYSGSNSDVINYSIIYTKN